MTTEFSGRRIRPALVALAAALGLLTGGPSWAQTASYPPGGPKLVEWSALPDWDGVWERGGDPVWDDSIPPGTPQRPSYTDDYAKLAAAVPPHKPGQGGGFAGGGMPGIMIMLFPMEIQINPHEVLILGEGSIPRRIYTDGRLHPKDPLPSAAGHSIGHWDGKALIVDTCCVKESTHLPSGGVHSDAMHIAERIWTPNADTLEDDITVEDPKAFTKPWTTKKTYYRRPDWEPVEHDEHENEREFPIDKAGPDAGTPVTKASLDVPPPAPTSAKLGKPADTQDLQKATSHALGNLAWESVTVSDIERAANGVKWMATTRSHKYHCAAATDGTNPYCDPS